ncbi:MAG: hypothetical protein QW429_03930 [Thermoprotei archaeon]
MFFLQTLVNQTQSALQPIYNAFSTGVTTIELFTIMAIVSILSVYVVEKVVNRTANGSSSAGGAVSGKA